MTDAEFIAAAELQQLAMWQRVVYFISVAHNRSSVINVCCQLHDMIVKVKVKECIVLREIHLRTTL